MRRPYRPGMIRVYNEVMDSTWNDAIRAWSLALRAAGRMDSTISRRVEHLRWCSHAMACGPWEVGTGDLLAWTGSRSWAVETRRSVRSSLRSFYAWGARAGYVDVSPAADLPSIRPSVPRPRPAPDETYRAALAGAGDRERLMLRLAAEAGLRRAEVAQVHARDVVADLTGWSLVVHGKGQRERVVPLTAGLALALRARVHETGGFAFPGRDGGHLSPRWVGRMVAQLLPGEHTMHALRHRFATRAYAVDRDLLSVQQLLGHASPSTTRVYVRLPDDALRRTVQAIA